MKIKSTNGAQMASPPTEWPADDMLEAAMGLICNASGGDWTKESPEWQSLAEKWMRSYSPAPVASSRPPLCGNCDPEFKAPR